MKKVLLIEDNPDNREIVSTALRKEGYHVTAAPDGETALKKVKDIPDLILLDLSLPKMSGWEVVRLLKENEDYRHIPVIALTAHAMVGDREKALASGCNDYLAKPCLPRAILEKTRKWIGSE
ncbi:MAG TPA: response regulator [bacterium]|nr:response regulator [bacterium]